MQLDIYRDQALEKLLIVERGTNIKQLSGIKPGFLSELTRPNQIDTDVARLPTGLKLDDVVEAVKNRGYFAATLVVSIQEIDKP